MSPAATASSTCDGRAPPSGHLLTALALVLACGDADADTTETASATDTHASDTSATTGGASVGTDATGDATTAGATTDASTDSDSDGASTGEATGEPPPDPGDPFEPAPPRPPLPQDVLDALAPTIDAILDGPAVAGTTQSVQIVDLDTGQLVYERAPDLPLKPASNTKLVTTAGALDTLGPDHRFTAEVYVTAQPDAQGVIAGDLALVGHHDPTWSDWIYSDPRFPLDQIARQLAELGVTAISGALIVQGEFLWQGDNLGYYDDGSHRALAAQRFAEALADRGVAAGPPETSPSFDPPGDAALLTTWDSPPLTTVIYPINVSSHNEFADISARHLGHELTGQSTYEAAGGELLTWLAGLGVDAGALALHDGSGLSHDNRLTARAIIQTLTAMDRLPVGEPWFRSFSVAGVRGTLASRMLGPDTYGRVYGKTGTLSGVIATSALVYNRHDGRRYLCSILMNQVPDPSAARGVQDDVITVIAGDLRGWSVPPTPALQRVAQDGAPGVAVVEWQSGGEETIVWLSRDGRAWDRGHARLIGGGATTHRAGQLPWADAPDFADAPVFVRVSARDSETGAESEPSDVYATRPDGATGRLLLVDGDDRWQADAGASNSRGGAMTFVVEHVHALDGRSVDTVANEAVVDGLVALADYDGVLWTLGEESTEHESFSAIEQLIVRDYLEGAGGRMLISGAEIGWDLVENGAPDDIAFHDTVLRASYQGDDAGTYAFAPAPDAPPAFAALPLMQFYTPAAMWANYPDLLAPAGGSEALLEYRGGLPGAAALGYVGAYRLVYLALPFESVDNGHDRALLMAAALAYLGL